MLLNTPFNTNAWYECLISVWHYNANFQHFMWTQLYQRFICIPELTKENFKARQPVSEKPTQCFYKISFILKNLKKENRKKLRESADLPASFQAIKLQACLHCPTAIMPHVPPFTIVNAPCTLALISTSTRPMLLMLDSRVNALAATLMLNEGLCSFTLDTSLISCTG